MTMEESNISLSIFWNTLLGGALRAALGFLSSMLLEKAKQTKRDKDRREKGQQMLSILEKEMEEGIERCKEIYKKTNRYKISTNNRESLRYQLHNFVDNQEVLYLADRVYQNFEIINSHIETNTFGTAEHYAS